MSDKKDRTVEEIRAEYSQLCAKAGHLQYQIFVQTEDLKLVNQTLKDLNFEAAAASQREAAKAAAPEEGSPQ